MTKRFLWNWAFWIGLVSGIYCYLYSMTPLAQYGVMQATFTALPIFLTSGASRKDYINYAVSSVTGVAWGILYVLCISWFLLYMNQVLSIGLTIFILTFACCAIHFIPTGKTWLNIVPAMFGGISSTFWIGGLSAGWPRVIALAITLVFGVTLALICKEGHNLLTDEGRWKFLSKKKSFQ